jgi:hypothetical protein
MIYIEATVEEWQAKYPGLEPFMSSCSACQLPVPVNRPYLENGFAGFSIGDCVCGKNANRGNVWVTTNAKTKSRWARILAPWFGRST